MKTLLTTTLASLLAIFLVQPASAQDEAKPSYTLITNITIFDGVNEETTEGSVLIENNLIKEVGAAVKAPQGATVINGGGRTLLPGLIDAHAHLTIVGPPTTLFQAKGVGVIFFEHHPTCLSDG